jgi:phosphorylcholine metabolism protein LicD
MKVLITIIIVIFIMYLLLKIYKNYSVNMRIQVHPKEKEKILKNMYHKIVDLANKHNIKICILYGTLLGYIREKNLICHDYDIDFFIEEKYQNILSKLLLDAYKYDDEYNVIIDNNYFRRKIVVIHKNTSLNADIDIFTVDKKSNTMYRHTNCLIVKYLYDGDTCRCKYPIDWFYPLKEVYFLGKKVYIPNNINDTLKCEYGKNYMISDKICNKSCTKCKMRK